MRRERSALEFRRQGLAFAQITSTASTISLEH